MQDTPGGNDCLHASNKCKRPAQLDCVCCFVNGDSHSLSVLVDPATKFKFIDIIFPLHVPHQKLYVAMGTLSMFAIIVVLITT